MVAHSPVQAQTAMPPTLDGENSVERQAMLARPYVGTHDSLMHVS